MMSRWEWVFVQFTGRLWFWAALYGIAAVATALVAVWLAPLIPDRVSAEIGADAVEDLLKIIASSMLAVATFSLSTMVASFAATTAAATPRAAQILIEDRTAQNAIATFIGAFLFSLVGIIALRTGVYGSSGRVVLFGVTILVILAVVLTLFRWIDYLSQLGRLGKVINKVEKVAHEALQAQFASPHLGGLPWKPPPPDAHPVRAGEVGYIQHLDIAALTEVATGANGSIYAARRPGSFVDAREPLVWVTWQPTDEEAARLSSAFLIGPDRSFKQDPRFGMIVLSEIASRALSPGVNDPGTAIDIIGRLVRLLSDCTRKSESGEEKIKFENVYVPAIEISDLFDDVFTPIARDGADNVEVGIRLQKALMSLARLPERPYREHALRHSSLALKRANAALVLQEDKDTIAQIATEVARSCAPELVQTSDLHQSTRL
jgi:uncharacterized membrane protein